MGSMQSGSLVDLAFLVKVERRVMGRALMYFRFRDDVFAVCESRERQPKPS